MKKIVRRFSRQFTYGQKGFTLIELLVVIAILGVLAVIVIPQVSKFIGSGTVQAANTEAHDVLTSVVAYMADNNLSTVTAGWVGPAGADDLVAGPAGTTPKSFLANPLSMQARYQIDASGAIIDAAPTFIAPATASKWANLNWANGSWGP